MKTTPQRAVNSPWIRLMRDKLERPRAKIHPHYAQEVRNGRMASWQCGKCGYLMSEGVEAK